MSDRPNVPIHLLLVEDNPADVRFAEFVISASGARVDMNVATDGTEALDILLRRGEDNCNAMRPDIILLDMHLPGMGGAEVLRQIKDDPLLKTIPCVVLTGSDADADVLAAYDGLADRYVLKPLDAAQLASVLELVP